MNNLHNTRKALSQFKKDIQLDPDYIDFKKRSLIGGFPTPEIDTKETRKLNKQVLKPFK